jgi:uncharacterized metal-binding protein/predicted Fe-Mo cluster-binding NifX family protein
MKMRYGIPIRSGRVAPRCTFAESILVIALRHNQARAEKKAELADHGLLSLVKILMESHVDTLICGGISYQEREYLSACKVEVIDNVACSVDELLDALRSGRVRTGLGLSEPILKQRARRLSDEIPGEPDGELMPGMKKTEKPRAADCLICNDKACLHGELCELVPEFDPMHVLDAEERNMLEASLDISYEKERTLCRLSELIYFCLEMHYRRIGIAYCIDLQEPADILVRVLRRFFEVYPVCCKVGGVKVVDPLLSNRDGIECHDSPKVACNPQGQANVLNHIETDLNVAVGICMGADCVFSKYSEAPVTTLFVKDKSLANNPIGAIYSDYYLNEAAQTRSQTK